MISPESREAVRSRIWTELEESGEARFPFPVEGRIPNFRGADRAAKRLLREDEFREASAVKINPDSPQRPVREGLLERGTILFMAVPRLAEEACFLRLDPSSIEDPSEAATLKGSRRYGEPVHPNDLPRIDAIVTGSVAVDAEGRRLGKGEGYSDLEFGLLREWDRIDPEVPIWTTVHEIQVCDPGTFSVDPHDLTLSGFTTPTKTVRIESLLPRPDGIDPERLTPDQRESIPILNQIPDDSPGPRS